VHVSELGAEAVEGERVVVDARPDAPTLITGGGITAGIDFGFMVVAQVRFWFGSFARWKFYHSLVVPPGGVGAWHHVSDMRSGVARSSVE
jgi:hypothetical protein